MEPEARTRTAVILEGEAIQRDLIRMALQRNGWEVNATGAHQKASQWMQQSPPDLLVLDTFLSGINGLDFLRRVKAAHLIDRTMVVLVSAFGFQEVVEQAAELGVRDFMVKPLDIDRFIKRINDWFPSPVK